MRTVEFDSTEMNILSLIGRGFSCSEIAQKMHLMTQWARSRFSRIYGKVGLYSPAIAIYALQQGFARLNEIEISDCAAFRLGLVRLSICERNALVLSCHGYSVKEIAAALYYTTGTIHGNLHKVRVKTNGGRRSRSLVVCALRVGFVDLCDVKLDQPRDRARAVAILEAEKQRAFDWEEVCGDEGTIIVH